MWHIDVLKTPPSTVDIVLIRDETNEFSPHRRPSIQVQRLGENIMEMVEQAQVPNQATSEPLRLSRVVVPL